MGETQAFDPILNDVVDFGFVGGAGVQEGRGKMLLRGMGKLPLRGLVDALSGDSVHESAATLRLLPMT